MVTGGIWRVRTTWRIEEQICMNILHFSVTSHTGTGATNLEVVEAIDAEFVADSQLWNPVASIYQFTEMQCIKGLDLDQYVDTLQSFGVVGIDGGGMLPRQCAGLITTRAALRGRGKHGRVYCGFLGRDRADNEGTLTTTAVGQLLTFADYLKVSHTYPITGPNQSTIRFGIYHRAADNIDHIASCMVGDKVATQRRRGYYGRPNT